MTVYNLLITDVTRYGDKYCVAGWDLDRGGMIRPEPQTATAAAEASRFWVGTTAGPGKFFDVGNIVRIEAAQPPDDFPFPHATEDRILVPSSNEAVLRSLALSEIANVVKAGLSTSIDVAFGGYLARAFSGKAHVAAGTKTNSLDAITIQPDQIAFYEDNYSPGKRKLRAKIRESGVTFDLTVPADAARSQFLEHGVKSISAAAAASDAIHVRLGLCRPFSAQPTQCFAQVNGLYFL